MARTLQALVGELARRGDVPAILAVRDETTDAWSYRELSELATRLAAGLAARGLAPGAPVALYAANRPEWIVACLAVLRAGAVAVPLEAGMSEKDLSRIWPDSGCRMAFTDRERAPRLAAAAETAPDLVLLDPPGREEEEKGGDRPAGVFWRELLAEPAAASERAPEDEAVLFYTSGTTGPPKGVPLTHGNILSNLDALIPQGLAGPGDRVLLPLPFHHVYPFTVGMLTTLAVGAALVLPAGMTGPEIARALRAGDVTVVVGVPRLYTALLEAVRRRAAAGGRLAAGAFDGLLALSRWLRRRLGWRAGRVLFRPLHRAMAPKLKLMSSGGAKLDADVAEALEALGWEVLSGYGLTETSPIVTFNARGAARLETVGRPIPGVEVRIHEPDADGEGEILVSGPNVFSGYRNDPEKTRRAFADGWFRTGDRGVLDADGYLRIVARQTETIVLAGGKKVFPEEVEAAYADSPFIREAAVMDRDGALAALVVPDDDAFRESGAGRIEDVLRQSMREVSSRLPSHQRVSGYAVTRQALPRTPLGKLQRHLLPAIYDEAEKGAAPPAGEALGEEDRRLLESEPARRLWEWLHERFPDRPLSLDASPQLDLGIDSMSWVNLTLDMEDELGITLGEEAISRVVTLRDLLVEVAAAEPGAAPGALLTEEQARWLEPPGPLYVLLGALLFAVDVLILKALFRLRVAGREHLPEEGAVLLAPNHASFLDPFALAAALPFRLLRRTWWGGVPLYLFQTAPRRLFSRAAHVFPVDADRAPLAGLAAGEAVLARGNVLVWFPEGGRSPDGTLQPFLPGVGRVVRNAGATVVPVRVSGTYAAWPRGRAWPRPRPVTVVFGEPLTAAELARRGAGEEPHRRIANALHDAVAALGDERGGV